MVSLQRLLDNTPADVKARAKNVTIDNLKVFATKKKDMQAFQFRSQAKAHTEKIFYDTVLEVYPNEVHLNVFEKPDYKHPCWVQCSCPFFLFNCEVALAKVGSSEIQYSNGKKPAITNPKQVPYLCKHLEKLAGLAIPAFRARATNTARYSFI